MSFDYAIHVPLGLSISVAKGREHEKKKTTYFDNTKKNININQYILHLQIHMHLKKIKLFLIS